MRAKQVYLTGKISIHAPREGSDNTAARINCRFIKFLSTLPARGATGLPLLLLPGFRDFYPRSPRGERHCAVYLSPPPKRHFYPRSPRGERLSSPVSASSVPRVFLSTLPARGATDGGVRFPGQLAISIHAPREGSDVQSIKDAQTAAISIHAPREGSDLRHRHGKRPERGISIHAPREGSDTVFALGLRLLLGHISIHAPREGSDALMDSVVKSCCISIHAPREGSDRCAGARRPTRHISIHAPREGSDVFQE